MLLKIKRIVAAPGQQKKNYTCACPRLSQVTDIAVIHRSRHFGNLMRTRIGIDSKPYCDGDPDVRDLASRGGIPRMYHI